MEGTLATIILFAGNFAPRNWAFCHGQILPINQNQALFSLLGTTYGGDGRIEFALPDLRSRVVVCADEGPGLSRYRLGEIGGAESVVMNASMLPPHTHPLMGSSSSAESSDPNGGVLANANEDNFIVASPDVTMHADAVGSAGGGQPLDIRQPYAALNYIICVSGLFPSRN